MLFHIWTLVPSFLELIREVAQLSHLFLSLSHRDFVT